MVLRVKARKVDIWRNFVMILKISHSKHIKCATFMEKKKKHAGTCRTAAHLQLITQLYIAELDKALWEC